MTFPDPKAGAVRKLSRCGAAAVTVLAVAAVTSGVAAADSVRHVPLKAGVTKVDLKVKHTTGRRPPAIVLSTSPASLRCSVARYSYVNREDKANFKMRIRCPQAGRGARAKLVFGPPLIRTFPLHDGAGTVLVEVDKPRGDVQPLGRLTTRPGDSECSAGRSRLETGPSLFTATTAVRCRDLPENARGILAVGGLMAPDAEASVSSVPAGSAPAPAPAPRAAAVEGGCPTPNRLTVGKEDVLWRDCLADSFTLGPWGSQWVGYIGQAPPKNCEAGWVRNLNAFDTPAAWLTVGGNKVDLVTDPGNAWSWSWRLGLVTNWQFSGDVTFWWRYRCFQVLRTTKG